MPSTETFNSPFARLKLIRPVSRIELIKSKCVGKNVLDIGCLDETAFNQKESTGFWLHEEIAAVAKSIIGIDNSKLLEDGPIKTGFSEIHLQDIFTINPTNFPQVDVIVMGELIEHLIDPLSVLVQLIKKFPNSLIVMSTPNATGITNVLGALVNRESNHPDHVAVYSYKILNTLMGRIENVDFKVEPYLTSYSESILASRGLKRLLVKSINVFVNVIERLRPFYSGGYVITVSPRLGAH